MYFLLPRDEMVGYSPLAFRNKIFKQAINNEQGNENGKIAAVLNSKNKNKFIAIVENGQKIKYTYKQIMEMYYSSIYALAVNKEWSIKHDIILSDSPDIIFCNEANGDDRIAIEVYEGFDFDKRNIGGKINIKDEVRKLYQKKGNKKYGIPSRLLIINRRVSIPDGFNVSGYCRELNLCSWNFSYIILCLFRQKENDFTFFYVYPKEMCIKKIDFVLNKDGKFWY